MEVGRWIRNLLLFMFFCLFSSVMMIYQGDRMVYGLHMLLFMG